MCYSIPGKVISISNNIALIDYFGEKKEALVDVEDIKTGDYVFAQGGVIVQKLGEDEAIGILAGWEELFFKLQEKDRILSETNPPQLFNGGGENQRDKNVPPILNLFMDRRGFPTTPEILLSGPLTKERLLTLLRCTDKEQIIHICKTANAIRHKIHKNASCVHGILEFSNFCKNDCAYCGIRGENRKIERYRMTVDEIVHEVITGVNKYGFKALVLQSGEDSYYTTERLVEIISRIRKGAGVLLILSIGERDVESYRKLYNAGARGVLIRFETSNTHIYRKIHTTLQYENRLNILKELKDIGYLIATGSLIGLPGQTEEDILEDIFLARSLNTEMYSFGPFIPHPDTPLAGMTAIDLQTMLKVIAVTRLAVNDGNILVTSAVEKLFGNEGLQQALMAGGNSIMINLTPERYRRLYSIYPGKGEENSNIRKNITETMSLLHSLGRAPMDVGK
ncbi:MAG: [FeFe] hydrogenase H-cluster radical SAM maturase HydE [Nitrospirae bacterium]|nr:[FeFe] hydrogenase H-cluster radical SAM maturase HydE [Nitrospirota bacterium]